MNNTRNYCCVDCGGLIDRHAALYKSGKCRSCSQKGKSLSFETRKKISKARIGKKLSKVADILVSGGLSGVMEAVCAGFKAGGGLTIGIIPSYNKNDANKFVDIAIPTGLGLARNVLVVKSADVVVALAGRAGTLSEIAYCIQFGIHDQMLS